MPISINSPAFAGLCTVTTISHSPLDQDEVTDDLEGEREGLPDASDLDLISEEDVDLVCELDEAIRNVSKGVANDTDKQYRR